MRFRVFMAGAALAALVGAGAAVARHSSATHTDTNGSAFNLTLQGSAQNATCTGEDGQYREFRATYAGPTASSSGDPRLTGTLRIDARGLINLTDNRGTVVGKWTLRDASGNRTARGEMNSVYREGILYGTFVGSVTDRVGHPVEELRGSGILIGNFKAQFAGAGSNMNGAFGGVSADNRIPSAIQGGDCGLGNDDD